MFFIMNAPTRITKLTSPFGRISREWFVLNAKVTHICREPKYRFGSIAVVTLAAVCSTRCALPRFETVATKSDNQNLAFSILHRREGPLAGEAMFSPPAYRFIFWTKSGQTPVELKGAGNAVFIGKRNTIG